MARNFKNDQKTSVKDNVKVLDTAIKALAPIVTDLHPNVNKEDTWIDGFNKRTSNIALGSTDASVYENIEYNNNEPMLAAYFSQYSMSVRSANRVISTMTIRNEIQSLLLDKFYTLVGQLENEFEWMRPSLKEKIKALANSAVGAIVHKINIVNIDAIYYAAYMSSSQKENGEMEEIAENTRRIMDPIMLALVAEIMAFITTNLYDAFYEDLVTEITSRDFDIICEYLKPYLIDFRNDMLCVVNDILLELLIYRKETTYIIYNQAKNFAEEMGVHFYY